MEKLLMFFKKQGVALLILGASIYGVMWVVENRRPPGSMTVVEAQAMDMKAMKAPIGVFPVGADYVLERSVGGSETFPATITALSDEDIAARVPGLIEQIHVYPGDRVSEGQLLATLEADELSAKALAETLTADAKQNQAQAARDNLLREQSALSKTEIDVRAYEAAVEVARADLLAAESHVLHYKGESQEVDAKRKEAASELEYATLDYEREKELFEGGAISRDDLDKAKKRIDIAQAKLEQVGAQRVQIDHELDVREAKATAAKNMVKQSIARLEGAKEGVKVSRSIVSSAKSTLEAKEREADAARASSGASNALSSYTELRASDDGVVTDRLVSPGTPVMPGQVVLRVKVDREVRVQVELPQKLSASVQVGSAVRVTVEGQSHDAVVTSVFPFVEGSTRTFRVEAIVSNREGNWQVGAYAEMEVFTSAKRRTLSVMSEAVKTASDGSHYVWVIFGEETEIAADAIYTCTMHPEEEHVGPGICSACKMELVPRDSTGNVRAQKRAVKIGVSDSLYTAVLGGLAEGEQVTWAGDSELFPGAAVQVVEWDESGPLELPAGAGTMEGMDMDHGHAEDAAAAETGSTIEGHEGHVHDADDLYYCPMHPEVHEPGEGICPICKMELLPMPTGGQ